MGYPTAQDKLEEAQRAQHLGEGKILAQGETRWADEPISSIQVKSSRFKASLSFHACRESVAAGLPADFLKAMKGAVFSDGSVTMFKIKLREGFLPCCSVSRRLNLFSPQDFLIKWGPGPIEISRSCPSDLNKPRIFICSVHFVWLFPKHNIKLPKKGKLILKSHCNLIIWNKGRNVSIKFYRTPAHQILCALPPSFSARMLYLQPWIYRQNSKFVQGFMYIFTVCV